MTRNYNPESRDNQQIAGCNIIRETIHIPGIIPTPVAGPPGTAAIAIRVHAPIEIEMISWAMESEGAPPVIPSPYGFTSAGTESEVGLNENLIFIGSKLGGIIPGDMATGGGHFWKMAGIYFYLKVYTDGPVRDIPLGQWPTTLNSRASPGTPGSPEYNYFPAINFIQGLLDIKVPSEVIQLFNPLQGVGP